MKPYPVQLEVTSPPMFDRVQLAVRLVLAIALGWVGITSGWLTCLMFLALPVIAAIAISTQGGSEYVDKTGPALWRAITWLLAFSAYMLLLVDRFPVTDKTDVEISIQHTAHPTVGSALLRLLMSIPSAFVLCLLGVISSILLVVSVILIIVEGTLPQSILAFQAGVLRWQARLLAYHASLVDEYPPFSFGERNSATPATLVG